MNRFEYYSKVQEYQENHIEHHGVLGQKWGIRRYQNPDGTLTEKGRKKYRKYYDENDVMTEKGRHQMERKETYYNNRSENDKRARNKNILKAGIKTGLTGVALGLYEIGRASFAILGGLNPIVIPIVGGVGVAASLAKAGYDHIDSKICEKRANRYYDLLRNSK